MKQENNFILRCLCSLLVLLFLAGAEASAQSTTKFASVYTDMTKDCQGQEPVFTCKGYGGYKIVLGIGGVFEDARVETVKAEYSLSLAGFQSIAWNPKFEWRMADGKPFAVIVRLDVNDTSIDPYKKTGEKLVVKGLKGFESLDASIEAKDPGANEKARALADQYYTGSKAQNTGSKTTGEAFDDGKANHLTDMQFAKLRKLNAAVAVPTYLPAGFSLKKLEIQEPEAYIIAFSMTYADAAGKTFQIQSNNEALGDMEVKREVKGKNPYFLDSAQETAEFYTGHNAQDAATVASEWLCNPKKYQPKTTEYAQCYQLLSDSKSIQPVEALKIMQSLRYLKR